uniref:SprT-like domain-containing protein n=1 Tax=Clastoptera arizonana TaxID=38151 RepID=A0A1B6DXM7_9HEMI
MMYLSYINHLQVMLGIIIMKMSLLVLESVRKKKQLPKSYNNDVDSLDFINDSSSENDTSMTLYRTQFTKDIKSEASDTFSKRKLDQRTPKKTKVRRKKLKLSFSDSDTENKNRTTAKENKVKTKTVKNCDKGLENDNKLHVSKPPTNYNFWNNLQNDLTPKIKNPHTPDKKCIKNKIVGRDGIQSIKYMPPKSVKTNSKDTNEIKGNESKSNILLTPKVPLLTPKTIKKECFPKFEDDIPKAWGSMEIMNTPLPKSSNTRTSPRLTLSFLSSLSEITGNMKCHPEAVIYKKEYKKKKEELACKLFYLYNKEIFESKLPSDMSIQWNARMRSTSGFCYNKRIFKANKEVVRSSRIVLSSKILDRADRLRDTLVHELCHAATWLVNGMSDGHGPHWRAWATKANYRFPELPIIKRCHDYHIVTKYTYKCVDCGYCIGRHSKSLDTNRKRCGYCRGKFEVFLTSKMSADKAPSEMTDTVKASRTPSAFAMFVKNNYALVKQESKNLRHGDVMKLLGQKFAAVKLAQA